MAVRARLVFASALVCACWLGAGAAAIAQQAADPAAPRSGEPRVQHIVTEDDAVRIEELRVRGQVQRITVHSKLAGVKPYEIVPAGQGRDLSQDKRTSGQRVWSVFLF